MLVLDQSGWEGMISAAMRISHANLWTHKTIGAFMKLVTKVPNVGK
jgi:hypothetical protein